MKIKYLKLLLIAVSLNAMDVPAQLTKIYVKTSDGTVVTIEQWKINEMKTLLVLLEHQKNTNSLHNPLPATMIDSAALQLVCDALEAISLGTFESFYENLVNEDSQLLPPGKIASEHLLLSLEQGTLRTLINAAERTQANGVAAFCLSYIMPPEVQTSLVPQFVTSIIRTLPATPILKKNISDVFVVAFNHDGTKLVSGCSGEENNLILWDMSDPENISSQSLPGHPFTVNTVAFSSDGTTLVSGCTGFNNNLIVWNMSDPKKIVYQILPSHSDSVNTIALSPDGTKLIVGCAGWQNNLILFDISNPENIKRSILPGHSESVVTVAFSSDGTKFVSGSFDEQNNLILWDIITPDDITAPNAITSYLLLGHSNNVYTAAFSSDNTKIISGSDGDQNNLILWDISNLNEIKFKILNGHNDNVHTALFSPDGTKIISGSNGNKNNLIIWDISNLNAILGQPLVGHPDNVITLAFGPHGTQFVSSGSGTTNNLILWNISNLNAVTYQVLSGHPDSVITTAFSPDDTNIASGCWGENNSLMVHHLVSETEKNALLNCDIGQARFLYQLCLESKRGSQQRVISPYTTTLLSELPPLIQQLIIKKLNIILPQQ